MLERDFAKFEDEMCNEVFICKEKGTIMLSIGEINKHIIAGKLYEGFNKSCSIYNYFFSIPPFPLICSTDTICLFEKSHLSLCKAPYTVLLNHFKISLYLF